MAGLVEELEELDQWDWRAVGAPPQDPSSPGSNSYSSRSSPDGRQTFSDFSFAGPPGRGAAGGRRAAGKPKMSSKRRMKASEREKLRMRSLAEALHQLRDYLPPGYSRRGQPLTKIQTLKSTIEYIKDLSDILSRDSH